MDNWHLELGPEFFILFSRQCLIPTSSWCDSVILLMYSKSSAREIFRIFIVEVKFSRAGDLVTEVYSNRYKV